MKRNYEKPRFEVTEFRFSEQIAASGTTCTHVWTNVGATSCTSGTPVLQSFNNA
ncbi:MAG: hypothetical protein VB055_05395 [Oscillospiraceae bacterium]|nr:hypothetical protein [Oscillospiraceae bacterium]